MRWVLHPAEGLGSSCVGHGAGPLPLPASLNMSVCLLVWPLGFNRKDAAKLDQVVLGSLDKSYPLC